GIDFTLPDGFPPGRIGLFSTITGVVFDDFYLWSDADSVDAGNRWINHRLEDNSGAGWDATDDQLAVYPFNDASKPILLKGVYVDRFSATFAVRRNSNESRIGFVLNATSQDDYDFIRFRHRDTAYPTYGHAIED